MSEVDLDSPIKSSLQGMGQVARFARDDVYFEDINGAGWLQSGFVSQDFNAFPDAYIHKTLRFESSGFGAGHAAYSPTLNLWVGTYTGSAESTGKRVYLSADNFATKELITIEYSINTRTIIWSDYYSKFFVASAALGSSTNYFLSSPNGRDWEVHGSVTAGLTDVIVTNTGRIIAVETGTATNKIIYSDDGGNSFSRVALPQSCSTYSLLSTPMGVYAFTNTGAFRSVDDGGTFSKVSDIQSPTAIYSDELGKIICSYAYKVLHCSDGNTFEEVEELSYTNFSAITVRGKDIFAVSGQSSAKVFHSVDGINFLSKSDVGHVHGITANDDVVYIQSSNTPRVSNYWFEYIGCSDLGSNKANAVNDFVRIK